MPGEAVETPRGEYKDGAQYALEMIGEAIAIERQRRGISQRALAEMTGLSQPHIHRIEANVGVTTVVTLLKVTDALGLDVSVLFKAYEAWKRSD